MSKEEWKQYLDEKEKEYKELLVNMYREHIIEKDPYLKWMEKRSVEENEYLSQVVSDELELYHLWIDWGIDFFWESSQQSSDAHYWRKVEKETAKMERDARIFSLGKSDFERDLIHGAMQYEIEANTQRILMESRMDEEIENQLASERHEFI